MLTASFRHIRGIGGLRERQLWRMGVRGWDALPEGAVLSPKLDDRLREGVAMRRARFLAGDFAHFAQALAPSEQWRMLPHLLDDAGFLDVETAGSRDDQVIVVGILDRDGARAFLRGRDLAEFPARAARWKCLVTFNGLVFDLPALLRAFPGWAPPPVHVDLCPIYRRLGEGGGLKRIETRLGLFRPPHLGELAGADAALLWRAQIRGDVRALRRLVEYNLYDAFHLRPLAEIAYNRLVRRCGMPAPELPVTERGALLYDVSCAVGRAMG